MEYSDHNNSDYDDYIFPDLIPEIQPIQIAALVFYGLVALLGIVGNVVVVIVTGFCMNRSVTSIWFLNLALADLLCCLSIPLLMVPLAHDDHWHFGSLACRLVKGLFYLVMYCSILQLVLISVDRLLLVTKPVLCQNKRRPVHAALACVCVWWLALIGSIPQFLFAHELELGEKRECAMAYTRKSAWIYFSLRFFVGFILPFLVIIYCHIVVYRTTQRGLSRGRTRSKRTLRIIVAVVLSFFFCWLPLYIMDFIDLNTSRSSIHKPSVYHAHVLALCLAYSNSCLNPLLYVCLGRGFKDSMTRSVRNIFPFISEDANSRGTISNITKTSSDSKEMTKV